MNQNQSLQSFRSSREYFGNSDKKNNHQSLPLARLKWKHVGKRAPDTDKKKKWMLATKKDKPEIKNKSDNNHNTRDDFQETVKTG